MKASKKALVRFFAKKYEKRGFSQIAAEGMVAQMIDQFFKGNYSKQVKRIARKYGFLPSSVLALGVNDENYQDFLSDRDYYSITPLNGEYHSWINNKITLKYLLGDKASYLPKYYFQILEDGRILRLFECSQEYDRTPSGIVALLKEEKALAIKRIEGLGGAGFYKAYIGADNKYYVNDEEFSEEKLLNFFTELKNYLVMEYLESAGLPAEIYPKTSNSIRVIYGKVDDKLYSIGSFIKFGNLGSGYVDNVHGGGIACPIDEEGAFSKGYMLVDGVMRDMLVHPDTNVPLCGKLDCWNDIISIAMEIMDRFPQLSYCGFDFVISDKGLKLFEINDMSGLRTLQKHCPLLKDKDDNFYIKRIEKKYGKLSSLT